MGHAQVGHEAAINAEDEHSAVNLVLVAVSLVVVSLGVVIEDPGTGIAEIVVLRQNDEVVSHQHCKAKWYDISAETGARDNLTGVHVSHSTLGVRVPHSWTRAQGKVGVGVWELSYDLSAAGRSIDFIDDSLSEQ